jgi:hypothetical protein
MRWFQARPRLKTARVIEAPRGRSAAQVLRPPFATKSSFGHTEMAVEAPPTGLASGPLEHVLFVTLAAFI